MADEEDQKEDKENTDAAAEGAEGEGEQKKSKLPLIIGAVVLLLVGGGAGAYFTGMLDGLLGKEAAQEETADGHGEGHGDAHGDGHGDAHGEEDEYDYGDHASYEEAEDDHGEDHGGGDDGHGAPAADAHGGGGDGHGDGHGGGGGGKYVTVPTMLVNLNTDDGTPRYLRLSVQIELRSAADYGAVEAVLPRVVDQFQTYLRELRVRDLRGSAGIYRLQMELLWRVNQAAKPVRVKDILFQEILIQ